SAFAQKCLARKKCGCHGGKSLKPPSFLPSKWCPSRPGRAAHSPGGGSLHRLRPLRAKGFCAQLWAKEGPHAERPPACAPGAPLAWPGDPTRCRPAAAARRGAVSKL